MRRIGPKIRSSLFLTNIYKQLLPVSGSLVLLMLNRVETKIQYQVLPMILSHLNIKISFIPGCVLRQLIMDVPGSG